MSVEKVKAYFAGFGMEDRVLEFPVSSATVAEAAAALHCEPCHIAKTMAYTRVLTRSLQGSASGGNGSEGGGSGSGDGGIEDDPLG